MQLLNYLILATCLILTSCDAPVAESDAQEVSSNTSAEKVAYTEIYDNGQVKIEGFLKNGVRVGQWMSYYSTGLRWSENMYRDGMLDGRSVTYYDNGHLRYEGFYIEDKKAGIWQFYDDSGKLVKKENFNK